MAWLPRSANDGHVCIRARIVDDPADPNGLDHEAQENFTDWYLESSSPYAPIRVSYQVANPVARQATIKMHARDVPRGMQVAFDPPTMRLDAGEIGHGTALFTADITWFMFEDELVARGQSVPVVSLESTAAPGFRLAASPVWCTRCARAACASSR